MKTVIALVLLGVASACAQNCPQGTARITTSYGSYCGAPQPSAVHQPVAVATATVMATTTTNAGLNCPEGTSRLVTSYGSYCGTQQTASVQQPVQVQQTAPAQQPVSAQQSAAQQPVQQSLANQDVLELLKAGLGADIITAKIKASVCSFDTSPAALKNLKDARVPDAVILA